MKKMLVVVLSFILVMNCKAEEVVSPYLQELIIGNGELTLEFDKMNTNYTVVLDEGQDELMLDYVLEDPYASVIIYNNYDLLATEKVVMIRVVSSDESDEVMYHLNVVKSESVTTFDDMSGVMELEIPIKEEKKINIHYESVIASICFLLILVVYSRLFRKSSNKIN